MLPSLQIIVGAVRDRILVSSESGTRKRQRKDGEIDVEEVLERIARRGSQQERDEELRDADDELLSEVEDEEEDVVRAQADEPDDIASEIEEVARGMAAESAPNSKRKNEQAEELDEHAPPHR